MPSNETMWFVLVGAAIVIGALTTLVARSEPDSRRRRRIQQFGGAAGGVCAVFGIVAYSGFDLATRSFVGVLFGLMVYFGVLLMRNCPKCGRVVDSGLSWPRTRFCPFCGTSLDASKKSAEGQRL